MAPAYCEGETTKELIKTRTESGKCFCIRVFLSFKLRSQIWNIEKEKDRGKEKAGRQARKRQREKELERERKNKSRHFLLEEQYEIL